MKALQLVGPRRFEQVELPDPVPESPGDVVVRPSLGCICGSDMPFYKGVSPLYNHPYPPGLSLHECIGIVAESRSDKVRAGDEVLVLPYDQMGLMEYITVPVSRVFPLPEGVQRTELLLAQPLGTVLWAVRKLGGITGQDVVVCGQGPIGLLFDQVLSAMGARRVIALDKVQYRLDVARRLGATHVVNIEREDPVAAVKDITAGKMADLSVEAVGHQENQINALVDLTRRLGTVLAFGVPDEEGLELRYRDFFYKNIALFFSVDPESERDFPFALELVAQGRVKVADLATHEVPLSRIEEGFALAEKREPGVLKVLVRYEW